MERPGSPEERETDMADWVDTNSPRFVAKQFILMADEIDRLREAINLVRPDPGLSFASQKVLDGALRGEE